MSKTAITATTTSTPILFLDIDDVICLNNKYSGFHVLLAVNPRLPRNDDVLRQVFSRSACEQLRRLHTHLNGKLRYVISSTWREHFTLEQMQTIFRVGGLDFVADALHPQWCTPTKINGGSRASDITEWLDLFHQGEPFAILDDTHSGVSLKAAFLEPFHALYGRVVLCDERVGLRSELLPDLVGALTRPAPKECAQ